MVDYKTVVNECGKYTLDLVNLLRWITIILYRFSRVEKESVRAMKRKYTKG